MEFKKRDEVLAFLNKVVLFNQGGQGICYRNRDTVYKIYHSFFDPFEEGNEYTIDEVLRFKDAKSKLIVFPHDVITVNGELIGDITKYVKAENLDKLNPLTINLNRLIKLIELALKEMELITKQHIKTYDVLYNTLLGDSFYVVDTLEYFESDLPYKELLDYNTKGFNQAIIYFLIDGLFTEVLNRDPFIKEIYTSDGEGIPLLEFVYVVRKRLSELVGHEIQTLEEARKYLNKKRKGKYKRKLDIAIL